MTHGTITGYSHHRCRCDECRAAWATYQREFRKRPGQRERHTTGERERRARRDGVELDTECAICGEAFTQRGLDMHLAKMHGLYRDGKRRFSKARVPFDELVAGE